MKSFQFDGCAANRKAMRDVLPGFFSQAVYIACCSHLMDNSGKFVFPFADSRGPRLCCAGCGPWSSCFLLLEQPSANISLFSIGWDVWSYLVICLLEIAQPLVLQAVIVHIVSYRLQNTREFLNR